MALRMDCHFVLCLVGLLLSLYAYYVKKMKSLDSSYAPLCDLAEHMQCSKVLTSAWSKGFGIAGFYLPQDHFLNISNAIVGITFYSAQIIAKWSFGYRAYPVLCFTSILASISSIYLAYILAFHLKDFCLVCVSTYVVNFSLVYITYNRWKNN